MKHKAKPMEFVFDQPLDLKLIQDLATDWDRVKSDTEKRNNSRAANDRKQLKLTE
jgi:hypothetical protein